MSEPGRTGDESEGRPELHDLDARIAYLEQRVAELDRLVQEAVAAGRHSYPLELALSLAHSSRSSAFTRRESLLLKLPPAADC